MAADKLTAKQAQFVKEYMIDLNATAAATRAGYSKRSAEVEGARLLRNAKVEVEIAKVMLERSERTQITADQVLKELWHIATDDIRNYLDFRTEKVLVGYDAQGKPVSDYKTIVNLQDSNNVDTRSISEISIGKDGQFKFKMYCKDNALVQVGKHLGMFKEKLEINGAIPVVMRDDVTE